jgi:hypothetical protein
MEPEYTALANRLAAQIRHVDAETIAELSNLLENTRKRG